MTKIEMELVTSEVELVRAALVLRALDASPPSAKAYERLAERLNPIGLYEFSSLEAACISVSLLDFSELSDQVGMNELARRTMALSDEFLCRCVMSEPLEEGKQRLDQVIQQRKIVAQDATSGWASPIRGLS